jgi:CDP-diacylglycerol--serine O-phosphatidyltransferase
MMKRAAFFPNFITAFALACGLFVIFKTVFSHERIGDYELVQTSAFLLLVAALADFVDGALARAIHAESEFGFVFDSLSDAISFGVAPSVLMLKTLSMQQGSFLSFLAITGAMVFSICGVLRLVRYNVKAKEAPQNAQQAIEQKKHFTGLPIPAAAIGAVAINLLFLSPLVTDWMYLSSENRIVILASVMIFLGYLMVCRLKFPSLKMLHFRIPSFHLVFLVAVSTIFVIYGILYFFALILALVSWVYIMVSLVLSLIRFIAGKKSKTLEEFEPDPEDLDPHS